MRKGRIHVGIAIATMLSLLNSLLVQSMPRQGVQVCAMLAIKIQGSSPFLLLLVLMNYISIITNYYIVIHKGYDLFGENDMNKYPICKTGLHNLIA